MEDEQHPQRARDGLVLGAHWGFLTFFIAFACYYLVSLSLAGLAPRGAGLDAVPLPRLGPLVLLAFVPNLLLGLVPVLGSRRWGRGVRTDFALLPSPRDIKVGLACGGFSLLAGYLFSLVLLQVYGARRLPNPLTDVFRGLGDNTGWLVVVALVVVVVAPLTEELLFRGALWSGLAHHQLPRWVILLLTALVFALLHGEPMRTVALLAQGIAIGAARMITGRVGASVIAHATNNLPPALLLFALS